MASDLVMMKPHPFQGFSGSSHLGAHKDLRQGQVGSCERGWSALSEQKPREGYRRMKEQLSKGWQSQMRARGIFGGL